MSLLATATGYGTVLTMMLSDDWHLPMFVVTVYVVELATGFAIAFLELGFSNPAAGDQENVSPSPTALNLIESVRQMVVSLPAFTVTIFFTSTNTESIFTHPGADVRVA